MTYKPNIFNIPANYHFFESLFDWLQENFSDRLSEVKIFLPNRRSCRQLTQIFIEKKLNAFLPKIKAISDLSYEDFFDLPADSETKNIIDDLLQIKVISGIDHLFFLTKEIEKLSVFGSEIEFNQAFKISLILKDLFDEIERAEIDLKKLTEIDDSDLSSHRQLTLDFLKNFQVQIKNSLLKENIFFTTSYQNFIVEKFTELLQKNGSKTPLVIAGSTGSMSFGKKLIKAISQQKNGYVVLHSLLADKKNFGAENHPQFFLNQLLGFLEIEKNSVKKIAKENFLLSSNNRLDLLSLLMLPSFESLKWQNVQAYLNEKTAIEDLEKNFKLIETKNEIEEAKIIALILAESTTQKKKSAVITNNRKLADLLKLELQKTSLPFNDTRNLGVFNSKLINFLLLILELIESEFNSHSLLATLKNPLCYHSQNKEIIADFEIKILRQERLKPGIDGIKEKLKIVDQKELNNFFEDFCSKLIIHPKPVEGHDERYFNKFDMAKSLSSKIQDLIKITENLSKKSWQKLLEEEPAQIELFEFFEELKSQNNLKISDNNFLASLKDLLTQISFFEKSDATSSIQILSTIEARLLNYDLVIIASLNEGEFPEIETDNWLGKKIRKDLEIERSAKKTGQNAYDFCNYLSNQRIVLTRSEVRNGATLIASPFLLKFRTLCQKIGANLNSGEEYFNFLKNSQSNESKLARQETNPKPKIEFRPKKLSITEISKLISDPYTIYAKKILELRELEKIDHESSYAEFGSFVHKALEDFIKNPHQNDFLEKSEEIFTKYFFSEEAKLTWLPKFKNIFVDFLRKNEEFSDYKNYVEIPVKIKIGENLISGKIDRLISNETGLVQIFDYKTGEIPTKKSVTSGAEPQLTIAMLAIVEGLIESELKNVDLDKIDSLNYWKLSASSGSEIKEMCDKNSEIKILYSAAKLGLAKLFEYFSDKENGYISAPNKKNYKKNEYSHLARIH
jgi:ATP-dependent helicase/nuclease subunit B